MAPQRSRLLSFARELQAAATFEEMLSITQQEVQASVGYRHAWMFVADPGLATMRLIEVGGARRAMLRSDYPVLTVTGDPMLEELMKGEGPVVVDDARTDPRTNKQIVEALGNRTIINVPLRLLDRPLGAFGTGTFADEGCRPPTPEQLDYLIAMGSQLAVAASRIQLIEDRAEAAAERLALERRLQRMQRLDSLGMLAGGVAHDFNNLLTIVLSRAGLLRSVEDETARADVQAIIGAAERASQLTAQLLAMGRMQELAPRPIDLNEQVRGLVSMITRVFPATIEIDVVAAGRLPLVHADESQVHQVLMNLCINARDAMPDGGRLTVETEHVVVNGSYVEAHPWAKPGRYVLITVTDTGVGMPREVVDRVFEPFFTTKTDPERRGNGLGMAVAYGIVRQHEGMMHCYSEVGVGTTFKVYLPVHLRQAVDVGTKLEAAVRGGDERILVAEDDPALGETIQRVLSRAGYEVVMARDGAEASRLAETERFDVVVIDMVMPRMGGAEAIERILERQPDTRVVVSSGYGADTPVPQRLAGQLWHAWLAKPYASDTLLRTIRAVLEQE